MDSWIIGLLDSSNVSKDIHRKRKMGKWRERRKGKAHITRNDGGKLIPARIVPKIGKSL